MIQLEFGGTDANKFKLYGGTNTNLINTNQITNRSNIINTVIFPTSINDLFTKLIQNP
jgi:hypothetical protein